MTHRKPRGLNGPLRVTTGAKAELLPNELPADKAGIERAILNGALVASSTQQIPLYELVSGPEQNGENNFDFTLPTSTGNEYLAPRPKRNRAGSRAL